jgi:hypothetical protein
MSEYLHHPEDDIPRFEPWLGVMACSLLPVSLALFLPSLMVPLITMTVVLFAVGLAMLRAQSHRRAHAEARAPRASTRGYERRALEMEGAES